MAKGDLPVLVGVGQSLSQWDGTSGADGAPSPLSLMVDASRAALSDSGADLSKAIDTIAVVRIFEDSVGGAPHPHGHNTNLPGTLARDIGAAPDTLIYETVGGQSPQALVNEMAARIHAGDADCVLISGSEANRASKGARRNNVEINWADGADVDYEDRGMGPMMLSLISMACSKTPSPPAKAIHAASTARPWPNSSSPSLLLLQRTRILNSRRNARLSFFRHRPRRTTNMLIRS